MELKHDPHCIKFPLRGLALLLCLSNSECRPAGSCPSPSVPFSERPRRLLPDRLCRIHKWCGDDEEDKVGKQTDARGCLDTDHHVGGMGNKKRHEETACEWRQKGRKGSGPAALGGGQGCDQVEGGPPRSLVPRIYWTYQGSVLFDLDLICPSRAR